MPGPGRFTPKEDRQIEHIKDSEAERGVPTRKAENIAYGTVVNQKKRSSGKSRISRVRLKK